MTRKPKADLRTRVLRAEELGSRNLANGNEASERGDKEAADRFYEKAQFWLDRYNKLVGNS